MSGSGKSIVIYSYYQKNDEYIKNFEFFLQNGIYKDIDYIFCINGYECSIDIPRLPNIKILERDNIDYDFGAYSDALKTLYIDSYDYFFFLNTSVRGPFLPEDSRSNKWTLPFIKLLKDDVKLVGTSINIYNVTDPKEQQNPNVQLLIKKGLKPPFVHVQSQMFLLDKIAIKYLISKKFFNQTPETDFNKFIALREVMMSQLILKNNWNINCLLPKYKNLDYRTLDHDINPTSTGGDPYYPGAYFGDSIDPYDVIFIKTNRNVSTDKILELTDEYSIYNANSKTNIIEKFESPSNNVEPNYLYRLLPLLIILTLILLYILLKRKIKR